MNPLTHTVLPLYFTFFLFTLVEQFYQPGHKINMRRTQISWKAKTNSPLTWDRTIRHFTLSGKFKTIKNPLKMSRHFML